MVRKETYSRVDDISSLPEETQKIITTVLTYGGCTFITFYERGGIESIPGYQGQSATPAPNECMYIEKGTYEDNRTGNVRNSVPAELKCGKSVRAPLGTSSMLDVRHVFPKRGKAKK